MIERLKSEIEPYKMQILKHDVYASLKSIEDVRRFMQFHVYAVWDFMSLLKSLQRRFTNVERIWYPKPNPTLTRLINQIIVAEEADVMETGEVISHYAWYIQAMQQAGSWTDEFDRFYEYSQISAKLDVHQLILNPNIQDFVQDTFQVIDFGADHEIAAYFLIGRESLIPDMFVGVVEALKEDISSLSLFLSYLKRHIEIDGGEHALLADQMLCELCGRDEVKWRESFESAKKALLSRKKLWDGVLRLRDKLQSG